MTSQLPRELHPLFPRNYICYRASESVIVDGRLDKPVWEAAPWTEEFIDIEGPAGPQPPFRTRVRMLWDDDYLYIGAWLEEPHIWATLTEHDSVIFQDNDFEIFIDPDGDNHQYYEIEINALNAEWDLRLVKPYRDGGPALNEWEIPGLKTAVHIDGTLNDPTDTDRGWSVEMAFPWSALAEFANCPCPPRDGDQWRINFSRVEWDVEIVDGQYRKIPNRPEHNWVWSPQWVIDMHRPERWGYVQFSTAPPGTAEFVPDPTAEARDLLMRLYELQREFHRRHGCWAASVQELIASAMPSIDRFIDVPSAVTIQLTEQGYTMSILAVQGIVSTNVGRLCVSQDSRLWIEE
jgi:hypothetical protein